MQVVAAAAPERPALRSLLEPWLAFERQLQEQNPEGGLGEPKFNLDGTVFSGPWARPQNDGPALRALAVIRTLRTLRAHNLSLEVDPTIIYEPSLPPESLLKRDLEYVARTWRSSGAEIWEECFGYHFYTRRVQALALHEGSYFAMDSNDPGAAAFYAENGRGAGRASRESYDWSPGKTSPESYWLKATVASPSCLPWKSSHLDSQGFLAHLHADPGFPDFQPPTNWLAVLDHRRHTPRVLGTLLALLRSFRTLYPINSIKMDPATGLPLGPALGRYPEDRYTGVSVEEGGGNPWILATAGAAEVLYRFAIDCFTNGMANYSIEAQSQLKALVTLIADLVVGQSSGELPDLAFNSADALLRRVQRHSGGPGSTNAVPLSEQLDKNTGFMAGARELSWSHASIVTATWARQKALEVLNSPKTRFGFSLIMGG